MKNHYLLWATGEDRAGIVAAVTKTLFLHGCNLEDSSMMRLGGEFGIFIIFSSPVSFHTNAAEHLFAPLRKKFNLSIGCKLLSAAQSAFKLRRTPPYMVTVHGMDRPGLVYRVTTVLHKHGFNISDLTTHRTGGKKPGYVLFIEGELPLHRKLVPMQKQLTALRKKLRAKIHVQPVLVQSI